MTAPRCSLLAAAIVVTLVSCGGGSDGDRTEGCDAAKGLVEAMVANQSDVDLDSIEAFQAAQREVARVAPDDVAAAMETVIDADPDSIVRDDQAAADSAYRVVSEWVTEDCGYALPNS